jgi:hypothetical protein
MLETASLEFKLDDHIGSSRVISEIAWIRDHATEGKSKSWVAVATKFVCSGGIEITYSKNLATQGSIGREPQAGSTKVSRRYRRRIILPKYYGREKEE